MSFDKNTKYSWITEKKVRSEDDLRTEILTVIGLSFVVAIILLISFFLFIW